jgi:hypothetical protein
MRAPSSLIPECAYLFVTHCRMQQMCLFLEMQQLHFWDGAQSILWQIDVDTIRNLHALFSALKL